MLKHTNRPPNWKYRVWQQLKKSTSWVKKLHFGPKKVQKLSFSGVFKLCTKLLRNDTATLQGHSSKQDYHLTGVQGVETKKRQLYTEGKCGLCRKSSRRGFFAVFKVCTKTLRKYNVSIRWSWNSQHSCPNRHLYGRKVRFGSKKHQERLSWGSKLCS